MHVIRPLANKRKPQIAQHGGKPDRKAERDRFFRVVDEFAIDYLYPESYFAAIRRPPKIKESMAVCG